jgi:hypothetical protein
MPTSTAVLRRGWWHVIGYEVSMLRWLNSIQADHPSPSSNLITEGRVLHVRNLCDFATSKKANDIKPPDMFDNYDIDARYKQLERFRRRLDKKYGRGGKGSARWAFNKKLAHPTKVRGTHFDYTRYLSRVLPALDDFITEIESLRGGPLL